MSTNYYRLKAPIASIEVADAAALYLSVTLHMERGEVAILNVPASDWPALLLMFAKREYPAPAHRVGGPTAGVVIVRDETLSDHTQLISEAGELTTLAEVRAKARGEK
jgi:hypothetical protein